MVLGFHGCDKKTADSIIKGETFMNKSINDYDWLGHGIYFWENIDLGLCLDLLDSENLLIVKQSYEILKTLTEQDGSVMPENKSPLHAGEDLLLRKLYCAVIQNIHSFSTNEGIPPYDTVRGVFWERDYLYPLAGF